MITITMYTNLNNPGSWIQSANVDAVILSGDMEFESGEVFFCDLDVIVPAVFNNFSPGLGCFE